MVHSTAKRCAAVCGNLRGHEEASVAVLSLRAPQLPLNTCAHLAAHGIARCLTTAWDNSMGVEEDGVAVIEVRAGETAAEHMLHT